MRPHDGKYLRIPETMNPIDEGHHAKGDEDGESADEQENGTVDGGQATRRQESSVGKVRLQAMKLTQPAPRQAQPEQQESQNQRETPEKRSAGAQEALRVEEGDKGVRGKEHGCGEDEDQERGRARLILSVTDGSPNRCEKEPQSRCDEESRGREQTPDCTRVPAQVNRGAECQGRLGVGL